MGTPPGFWLGSGVAGLGAGELRVGDVVSEAQLELLVGLGRDPITGAPLGRAYPVYASVTERIEHRVASLDPTLNADERAEKTPRRAVAGYDFTFSVPKSVSALWAVADAGTQALIANAHHQAVAEVVAFMEREVVATRAGTASGNGAVAQVDTHGVIATAYDHYDSRAGDPHLHTHVVVSNKVKTVLDDRWRSLDGRPLHAAVVALSELHEAIIADHLTRIFGLNWVLRDRGRDRNPTWDVEGVQVELMEAFSSRASQIDLEARRLVDEYTAAHGKQPSKPTILRLRAQATLSTRPEKQVHSLAELTAVWRARASRLLGTDATSWARTLTTRASTPVLLRADDVALEQIDEIAATVVAVVGEKRATWRRWNLHAEASRQIKGWRFASSEDREAVTGMIADAAEHVSLQLTPPELAVSPPEFQRGDGTSVFRPRHSALFSSQQILDAEDRLLNRSHTFDAPVMTLDAVEAAAERPDRQGRVLGRDQIDAIAAVAVSGRSVDVLVGPAGAGKTTAMVALRAAWEREHGPGSVVGLAPSAVAADVLASDLGIMTENTAKWLHEHHHSRAEFMPGQLVIIDEASLAGTHALDTITHAATEAGAKTLLVGDWAQLHSVDAGGAFALLVHDRGDAPELVDIHRFTNEWEKLASLDLRHGRTDAIAAYAAHGRIVGGDPDQITDAAYTAWRADTRAGFASILIAQTRDAVDVLNERARLDRIIAGEITPDHEIQLAGGARASAGDLVVSRQNDRRLRAGRTGWVRNGDRWTITSVHDDGAVNVRRAGFRRGATVTLPAAYVAEHLDLGYAATAHGAQGVTVDTAHAVITPGTTRENLYVALTRGRHSNIAYVATDQPDDLHGTEHTGPTASVTAEAVLGRVLPRIGAERSAHETITSEQEAWSNIGQLAAEYETIAAAAQHDHWANLIRRTPPLTAEQVERVISSDRFGALAAELRRAEADHHDLEKLLPRLVAARGFDDAADMASVLHHRVEIATQRPGHARPGKRTTKLIAGLIPEAAHVTAEPMRRALDERRQLIEQRATELAVRAIDEGCQWVTSLGEMPQDPHLAQTWMQHVRVVAAFRDRYQIDDDDPVGPPATETKQQLDRARAVRAVDRARAAEGRASPRSAPTGRADRGFGL